MLVTLDQVRSAQAGNHEALVEILRSIEHQVYQTAFYMLGNEQDALDASQEALLRVYTKINSYEEKAQFKTWVQKIVSNICIDQYRRKKQSMSIDEHEIEFSSEENIESNFIRDATAEEVRHAIDQLPEHHRTAIVLCYMQDFSYQEIADTMELPINTVKSYIFRGKQALQYVLQTKGYGGDRI
jgi:RNA polymerase sigma factor (sigma-70 family)